MSPYHMAYPAESFEDIVFIPGEIKNQGFSLDVLYGERPPEPAVKTIVPVIAHNKDHTTGYREFRHIVSYGGFAPANDIWIGMFFMPKN